MTVSPEFRNAVRHSRWSALLTVIGLIFFVASLIYSYMSLSKTEGKLAAARAETAELQAKTAELERTNAEMETRKAQLLKETDDLEKRYTTLKQNVEQVNVQIAQAGEKSAVSLRVADQRIYEIKTTTIRAPGESQGRPLYNFKLFVSGNPNVLDSIERVTYTFDHPTFREKQRPSTSRADQFAISYLGWGCLSEVGITVFFKDGDKDQTSFDMCKSLGWTD